MTDDPTVHAGALAQAIRLLRWWADNESDDECVVEQIKQSREAARDLTGSLRRWERRKVAAMRRKADRDV